MNNSKFTKGLSLSDTVEKLRNGKLDLLDFIKGLCDWIEKSEPEIHSLLPEPDRRKRLLNEAVQLLRKYPLIYDRPLFFGVPIGVKDIFRVDGFETRCGSSLPAELFKGKEASCVTKLKDAGAIILGKTVTTEFAYFEPGPTKNPNNKEYTPGGSSSGSAAAVAAGFAPFTFGTQTIGSIIRPASYCGVVGFKPSYGRIQTDGVIPFSQSADHVGFFTQDLDGCIMAASLLCDHWNESNLITKIEGPLKLGVPEGNYLAQASDDILQNFEENLRSLENRNILIKRIRIFDDIVSVNEDHRLMVAAEMAAVHRDWFKNYKELYRQHTKQIIEEGEKIATNLIEKAISGRILFRNAIESAMDIENVDLWVSPSVLSLPPKGISSTGSPLMNLPWTYAGLPSATIPMGNITDELPSGLQFTGTFGNDEKFLGMLKKIFPIV